MDRIGELAAFLTALSWAGGSLFFASAARRQGAPVLNVLRIVLATLLLALIVPLAGGDLTVPGPQLLAIAVSGVLGIAVGDAAYFRCLEILGARRSMVLGAIWPAMAALLMYPLLGETLGWFGVLGIAVTTGGVIWVQTERDDGTEVVGNAALGMGLGLLGALGQATGFLCAKVALGKAPAGARLAEWFGVLAAEGAETAGTQIGSLECTLLRMLVAMIVLVVPAIALRRTSGYVHALRDRTFVLQMSGGVVLGTVLGIWLSLVAVGEANTAVASTIIATSPVLVIPLLRIVHGRTTSWRGWIGALVALAGVAILAFREELAGGP